MRACKNCKKECISIYCSDECNKTYKSKTKWIINNCLTCGKETISRISRTKRFCSVICANNNVDVNKKKVLQHKETCLRRYGVENHMSLKENVDKIRNTNIKKYGVDWYSKTTAFKKDFVNTCKEKYGVDYPQQSELIRKKTKQCVNDKYGGFTLQSSVLKEKVKSTMMEKYGVDSPLKCNDLKIKQQKTNIERYGCISPLTNEFVKYKTSRTLKETYGVKNISQLPKIKNMVREKNRELFLKYLFTGNRLENKVTPLFDEHTYKSVSYDTLYPFKCNVCNLDFKDNLYAGNIPRCPTCFPVSISIQQDEIYNFIQSLLPTETILKNKRNILPSGKELDIYISSKKIAIEYDGIFWHSEISGGKHKNYHLNKTVECEKLGIHLIHIFENEWLNKKSIIIEKIKHLLNRKEFPIIGARKCEIKELSAQDSISFLEKHHLQGKDNASIRFGAYYNNELVSVMTFGKQRCALGSKNINKNEYEMYRFCLGEKHIIGIGSKLFRFFIKTYSPHKIITYADRRYSNSNAFYTKIGMSLVNKTSPNYWYFSYHDMRLHHRFGFRKSELPKKLTNYDPNLTEWQNMQLNGYDRIWDCGHYKYEWIKT